MLLLQAVGRSGGASTGGAAVAAAPSRAALLADIERELGQQRALAARKEALRVQHEAEDAALAAETLASGQRLVQLSQQLLELK